MPREGVIAFCCAVGGLILLLAGLFVPAHFRAVDWEVIRVAGEGTPSGLDLASDALDGGGEGPAAVLFRAVLESGVGGESKRAAETGLERVAARASEIPGVSWWGGTNAWLDACCGEVAGSIRRGEAGLFEVGIPVLAWLLPSEARQAVLGTIQGSTEAPVMALLSARRIEHTVVLPPVSSASGQPLDAGLLLASALVEQQRGRAGVALEWERGAMAATQGQGSEALELAVLDLLAAARIFDWEQLATLLDDCEDGASLHRLVEISEGEPRRWAALYSLVAAGGSARKVSDYLARHGESGLGDLRRALGEGTGAVQALLRDGNRIHVGRVRGWLLRLTGAHAASRWVVSATQRAPNLALAVRYLLWLDGFFLVILGLWWGRRIFLADTNRRFQPRPDFISVGVVAATAALGLFLASERFLGLPPGVAAGRAASGMPVLKARLRFELPPAKNSLMNEKVIGMLVLFFVTQFAIYLIGLSRLRHIRGQGVKDRVKLKLLDNEESMFDAPLYLGIAGSVLALVLRLTGFGDVSLMASYSSTLFGILFCFMLKVMHVRPYRQQLILESSEQADS
ncbi:MAG: hypothetical protein AB7O66_10005 [Limisphaerales bacterium]